ncbi:MAG: hypothetical protein JWP30_818 [Homoserinimonas sp.]|nr:hypothetical protein [Homoserinimonas sp.]
MTLYRRTKLVAGGLIVLAVAGCSPGLGGPPSSREARDGVVRFTFAPDPIWDYMHDEGIIAELEAESGIKIETSATWDEFGLFAGGHADIISSASFEVPGLEKETNQEAMIIGRYNSERSRILVRDDSTAESLADLQGKKFGVFTSVSGTLVWSALVKQMHDLDLRSGGGDFDVVMADIQNLSSLLARGEIDACICYPDLSARELKDGSVRALYEGKSSAEVFSDLNAPGHDGPMGNVFVARRDWVASHPKEVKFFLDLWERGLQEWQENMDEIIARYPQHFAVEDPDDVEFVTKYVHDHDWVVDEIRFGQTWVDNESKVFDLMRETGAVSEDVLNPRFLPADGF